MHSNEKLLEEHGVAMKRKLDFPFKDQLIKARQSLGGIETMSELPNIVIISSLIKECVAVDEVRRLQVLGVPIYSIGLQIQTLILKKWIIQFLATMIQ